jgi:hypothetical protein
MSLTRSRYYRVAKKYRWDYLRLEIELAASLERAADLQSTCSRLSADIDSLLGRDAAQDSAAAFNRDQFESRIWLVDTLTKKLAGYRRAYHQQAEGLVNLRQQLLYAKLSRDKSEDKHQQALQCFWQQRNEQEISELAEAYTARTGRLTNTMNHTI